MAVYAMKESNCLECGLEIIADERLNVDLCSKCEDNKAETVVEIFDKLATEVYYGFNFRMFLMDNPAEFESLKKVVNAISQDRAVRHTRNN